MNRKTVLFHLCEAVEELNKTMNAFEKDAEFDEASLELAMGHLYHHLNTAWNGRDQTDEQFQSCTDEDFVRFRKFPNEEEFSYLMDI
jgi:hypothetical protein